METMNIETVSAPSHAAAAMRVLRVLQAAMLASVVVIAVIGELVGPPERQLGATLYILSAVALMDAGFVVFVRAAIIPRAEHDLRQNLNDAGLWKQWRTTYVVAYVVAESVALFGLLLRFLGASLGRIIPLYVIAAALIFFSTPRPPESA
jgi:hypothetical protein